MKSNNNEAPVPEKPGDILDEFKAFVEIVRILRRECPWDSTQSNESIAHLMIEEAYEAIDAIYENDYEELSRELGDLLLHIVMHSVMAEETGKFNLADVIARIRNKMVSRHPHVFGETQVSGAEEVLKNWEHLKKKEGKKSALEGVPNTLPALLRAERIQHKASRVGFDWKDASDVWAKVYEELGELREEIEAKSDRAPAELGDFLFSIVNAARKYELVAEEALHLTNAKFTKRFQRIEQIAREQGRNLEEMTLEEMDEIWEETKKFFK